MGNFLKNNFISVAVCLMALGALSFADTYVRPYGAPNYAAGTRAVGSVVNSEFESLKNWLNGGNISSENIAALGIATSNIQDDAVTPAKMARLTPVDNTGSTLPFTASGSCPTTGGALTITTSGRPVYLNFRSLSSGSRFRIITSLETIAEGGNLGSRVEILRDGSSIFTFTTTVPQTDVLTGPEWEWSWPASSFSVIDNPTAGTYTYQVRVTDINSGVCGSSSSGFTDAIYNAYEL